MIMSNLATVITGASSGIGEELAKQLAAQEQQTLVLVARRADKLQALAAQLKQAPNYNKQSAKSYLGKLASFSPLFKHTKQKPTID